MAERLGFENLETPPVTASVVRDRRIVAPPEPAPDAAPIVTVQTAKPITIALLRAVIGGVVAGGLAGFAVLAGDPDASARTFWIAAGGAFFGVMQMRGLAEGAWDSLRVKREG